MDEQSVFTSQLIAQLPYSFQEGLPLNVADRATNLYNDNIRAVRVPRCKDAALDLIGNMGNNLDSCPQITALALPVNDRFEDAPAGHAGTAQEVLIDKALIMPQVQVTLRAVLCDKNLAMLIRVHGARVYIQVRIQLLHRDP